VLVVIEVLPAIAPLPPSVTPVYGPLLLCPDESIAVAVPAGSPSRQYACGPSALTIWSYAVDAAEATVIGSE
jgi:hypothetical protein